MTLANHYCSLAVWPCCACKNILKAALQFTVGVPVCVCVLFFSWFYEMCLRIVPHRSPINPHWPQSLCKWAVIGFSVTLCFTVEQCKVLSLIVPSSGFLQIALPSIYSVHVHWYIYRSHSVKPAWFFTLQLAQWDHDLFLFSQTVSLTLTDVSINILYPK